MTLRGHESLVRSARNGLALLAVVLLGACLAQPPAGGEREIRTDSDQSTAEKRARVRLELASAYFSRGQPSTALDEIKLALAAKSDLAEAFNLRGLVYGSLGETSAGRAELPARTAAQPARWRHAAQLCVVPVSPDGVSWGSSKRIFNITREQSYMSEMFWVGHNQGLMVLRSGDIFRTDYNSDATYYPGRNWTKVQPADSVVYPIPASGGSGWGQKTILIKDQAGNDLFVHTSTLRPDGNIYRLLAWGIEILSSAPIDPAFTQELPLNAYPNPATGTSQLQFQLSAPEAGMVVVVDPLGREVIRRNLGLLDAGQQQVALDVAGLPAGMHRYILQLAQRRAGGAVVVAR